MLEDLRQRLRALERPPGLEDGAAALALGVPEVDSVLGGGLACGTLHEIAALSEAHLPAAAGFVAGLARAAFAPFLRPAGRGESSAMVWLAEDMGLVESGALYGPGLLDCGIRPEKLVTVAVAHRRDLLWAMEESLRCRSVRLVVGEMRAGALDGVAVRRLSLAAAESGALALILRAAPPDDASTAATRWLAGATPSSSSPGTSSLSSGREGEASAPHFILHLTRNRRGVLGSWILTWSDSHGFQLATHAQPVAGPLRDRPHRAVA